MALASRLPDLMAASVVDAWAEIDHPAKRAAAGWLAAAWYMCVVSTLDAMRAECPAVPEPDRLPEAIERLRKIARDA